MPRKGMISLFFHYKPPASPSPSADDTSSSSTLRPAVSPCNIDLIIETASLIIEKWDPEATTVAKVTSLFHESKREALQFIKSVNNLHKAMVLLIAEDPSSYKLVRAQKLMQIAMNRLKKEFYQILTMNRAYLDPESVSARSSLASTRSSTSSFDDGEESQDGGVGASIAEVEDASSAAMVDLKKIADCMIANGYAKECVSIYRMIRKSIIDEAIFRLGVERISSSQASKMDWEVLDMKIKKWLDAVNISVKTLFHGEKILSDQIFATSASTRESSFAHISRDGAAILFGFPEIVSKIKKKLPQKKIFRVLDMYAVLSENWQEMESIFSSESTTSIRLQALNSLAQLSEYARLSLSEFENSLQKDSSKALPSGGGVHPLTLNTMNYISLLADYSYILSNWTPPEISPLPKSDFDSTLLDDSSAPAFSRQLAWLILILLCNLDGKAKHYKDVAVSYLFLANNLQHVISKVRSSNLRYLLGSDWISKHEAKVKQFAGNYVRIAWGQVVASLPETPLQAMTPATANEAVRRFCSSFEETYRKQRPYIVPDGELRDEIKVSILRKILPTYREVYDSQKLKAEGDSNSVSSVRFTPEDVGNYLSDLFFGTNTSSGTSSESPSSSSYRRRRLWSPKRFKASFYTSRLLQISSPSSWEVMKYTESVQRSRFLDFNGRS